MFEAFLLRNVLDLSLKNWRLIKKRKLLILSIWGSVSLKVLRCWLKDDEYLWQRNFFRALYGTAHCKLMNQMSSYVNKIRNGLLRMLILCFDVLSLKMFFLWADMWVFKRKTGVIVLCEIRLAQVSSSALSHAHRCCVGIHSLKTTHLFFQVYATGAFCALVDSLSTSRSQGRLCGNCNLLF